MYGGILDYFSVDVYVQRIKNRILRIFKHYDINTTLIDNILALCQ